MSYRSIAAQDAYARRQTTYFTVTLANGDVGRIAGVDVQDAQREAARWAKVRKSTVATIETEVLA